MGVEIGHIELLYPSCVRDLGAVEVEGAEGREFEIRIKLRGPPKLSILGALKEFERFFTHPTKEPLPNEQHDETLGGGASPVSD